MAIFLLGQRYFWENDWSSRPSMKPDEAAEISLEGKDALLAVLQYSKFASRLYALWAIQTDDRFAEKQAQLDQLRDVDQLQSALGASEQQLDAFALSVFVKRLIVGFGLFHRWRHLLSLDCHRRL